MLVHSNSEHVHHRLPFKCLLFIVPHIIGGIPESCFGCRNKCKLSFWRQDSSPTSMHLADFAHKVFTACLVIYLYAFLYVRMCLAKNEEKPKGLALTLSAHSKV